MGKRSPHAGKSPALDLEAEVVVVLLEPQLSSLCRLSVQSSSVGLAASLAVYIERVSVAV